MKNIIFETELYRIIEEQDHFFDIDILKGDQFDPKVNSDIDPDKLKAEEQNFESLVENEGVFSYLLEKKCRCCQHWRLLDSCGGFVGKYSETDSRFTHYIIEEFKKEINKPQNFNNLKSELSQNDIDQIMAIIGSHCRQKTLVRLRSILTYGTRMIPSFGILERLTRENGRWEYTAGQSYQDEIRTIRELILEGK